MSIQQIREILDRMEGNQKSIAIIKYPVRKAIGDIKRIKERVPASCPNWINQCLEPIIENLENALKEVES